MRFISKMLGRLKADTITKRQYRKFHQIDEEITVRVKTTSKLFTRYEFYFPSIGGVFGGVQSMPTFIFRACYPYATDKPAKQ